MIAVDTVVLSLVVSAVCAMIISLTTYCAVTDTVEDNRRAIENLRDSFTHSGAASPASPTAPRWQAPLPPP